jgi:hypothetical protein
MKKYGIFVHPGKELTTPRPRYFVLFLNSPIKIVIRSWIYEDSIELLFEVFIVYSKMYWNVKWNVCSGMWNILNIIRKQKHKFFSLKWIYFSEKKIKKKTNQGKERKRKECREGNSTCSAFSIATHLKNWSTHLRIKSPVKVNRAADMEVKTNLPYSPCWGVNMKQHLHAIPLTTQLA